MHPGKYSSSSHVWVALWHSSDQLVVQIEVELLEGQAGRKEGTNSDCIITGVEHSNMNLRSLIFRGLAC